MKVLEIIHVRAIAGSLLELSGRIADSLGSEETGGELVCIYRRRGLQTDLAVHIRRADARGTSERSELGLRLAAALKQVGAVKHTVWEELA